MPSGLATASIGAFLDEVFAAWGKNSGQSYNKERAQATAARIRKLREGVTLGSLKIKDMISEGRA